MRHGLIHWNDADLSVAEIEARQDRLREAMQAEGLDALVLYTNHVRSAGVTWATGFTPYWSQGLWVLSLDDRPLTAVALSPRVGDWIRSTNPTSDLDHSPRPGVLIGKKLAETGARRVGVVECDRLPNVLGEEITGACDAELVDASGLFWSVRLAGDDAENRLVTRAAEMAAAAFASVPGDVRTVGDATRTVEQSARLAGAEEVYIAAIPDLSQESRFARVKGTTPVGERYALRLTLARHGTWIRWIRSFGSTATDRTGAESADWFADLCATLSPGPGIDNQIAAARLPEGTALSGWLLEAPVGTRPLQIVAENGTDPARRYTAACLTVQLEGPDGMILLGGPLTQGGTQ
jgi:Xaa-Pro aminopeptidase